MTNMRLHMISVYLFVLFSAVAVRVWQIMTYTDYSTGNLNRDATFSIYILVGVIVFCFLHVLFFSGYAAKIIEYKLLRIHSIVPIVAAVATILLLGTDFYYNIDLVLEGKNILFFATEIVIALTLLLQAISFYHKKKYAFKGIIILTSVSAILINSFILVSDFTGHATVQNTLQHSFYQVSLILVTLFLVCSAAYFIATGSKHDYKLMVIASFLGALLLAIYILPGQVLLLMGERPSFLESTTMFTQYFSIGLLLYLFVFGISIIFGQESQNEKVLK